MGTAETAKLGRVLDQQSSSLDLFVKVSAQFLQVTLGSQFIEAAGQLRKSLCLHAHDSSESNLHIDYQVNRLRRLRKRYHLTEGQVCATIPCRMA